MEAQTSSFSVSDIPELDPTQEYWVYDYFAGTTELLSGTDRKKISLGADGYGYYILLPKCVDPAICKELTQYTGFVW